jgi:hypothetical protein
MKQFYEIHLTASAETQERLQSLPFKTIRIRAGDLTDDMTAIAAEFPSCAAAEDFVRETLSALELHGVEVIRSKLEVGMDDFMLHGAPMEPLYVESHMTIPKKIFAQVPSVWPLIDFVATKEGRPDHLILTIRTDSFAKHRQRVESFPLLHYTVLRTEVALLDSAPSHDDAWREAYLEMCRSGNLV